MTGIGAPGAWLEISNVAADGCVLDPKSKLRDLRFPAGPSRPEKAAKWPRSMLEVVLFALPLVDLLTFGLEGPAR